MTGNRAWVVEGLPVTGSTLNLCEVICPGQWAVGCGLEKVWWFGSFAGGNSTSGPRLKGVEPVEQGPRSVSSVRGPRQRAMERYIRIPSP